MNQGKSAEETEGSAMIAGTCFLAIAVILLIAWLCQ